MSFFRFNRKLNPLVGFGSSIFIIIFGLVTAKHIECVYFLLGAYLLFFIFGCWKACLKIIPMYVIIGGIFFLVSYLVSKKMELAIGMANRFGAIFVGLIPGLTIEPVDFTRSLSQAHTPRAVTLGMLITMSFMPMLKNENRRVREAMKTRGAGSILNPKIFYRALLFPLVMRLVNISDMLALSVETRGFTLEKAPYSIYKKQYFYINDLIFIILLLGIGGLTLFL